MCVSICVHVGMCVHYLWSTVILSVLMKSWYPGNFEVTIEKTCQSYSSIMASMRRASCCRAAPNWKNVDFSSCNDTQESSRDSQQICLRSWINCRKAEKKTQGLQWVQIRLKNPIELKKTFSILQSVSQMGRAREIRESVHVRETTGRERKWGKVEEGQILKDRDSVNKWDYTARVSAGNRGALMGGDNSLITHRFDSLQPSVANVTTAVYCLES